MIALRPGTDADRPRLLAIWQAAIDATHDFLSPAHRREIEGMVASEYIPHAAFLVAEEDGRVVAFLDATGSHVDSLFVDPPSHGRGVGRALMARVNAASVDVNEQNPGALGFYRALGFAVAGRSATDEGGRPYPILHLHRDASFKAPAV